MANRDKRVELYINNSAEFAQPILWHLTALVHEVCHDVDEDMKWNFPHFIYKGSILCSMASFKHHCSFGFWLASKMKDPKKILSSGEKSGMGQLGKITSLKDLPSDTVLKAYIKEAMALINKGTKLSKKPSEETKKSLVVPDYFIAALKKNKKALIAFENISYSHRKEYIEWISSAKKEETRKSRVEKAIAMLSEGKSQHHKYEK